MIKFYSNSQGKRLCKAFVYLFCCLSFIACKARNSQSGVLSKVELVSNYKLQENPENLPSKVHAFGQFDAHHIYSDNEVIKFITATHDKISWVELSSKHHPLVKSDEMSKKTGYLDIPFEYQRLFSSEPILGIRQSTQDQYKKHPWGDFFVIYMARQLLLIKVDDFQSAEPKIDKIKLFSFDSPIADVYFNLGDLQGPSKGQYTYQNTKWLHPYLIISLKTPNRLMAISVESFASQEYSSIATEWPYENLKIFSEPVELFEKNRLLYSQGPLLRSLSRTMRGSKVATDPHTINEVDDWKTHCLNIDSNYTNEAYTTDYAIYRESHSGGELFDDYIFQVFEPRGSDRRLLQIITKRWHEGGYSQIKNTCLNAMTSSSKGLDSVRRISKVRIAAVKREKVLGMFYAFVAEKSQQKIVYLKHFAPSNNLETQKKYYIITDIEQFESLGDAMITDFHLTSEGQLFMLDTKGLLIKWSQQ